jgi:hypothetical protein
MSVLSIEQEPPDPECMGRSEDLMFDESRRIIVSFRTEKTDPTADHGPSDRKTEENKYLSVTKMREKKDSRLQTTMRERAPIRGQIRSPSPDEGSMMNVTGPTGPIEI